MIDMWMILVVIIATVIFSIAIALMRRLKVIPSDKIIVVFGKVGKGKSSICQHGGARFIIPFIQSYKFLDLTPMTIDILLENALSRQNIRVSVPSRFTIGISTDPVIMQAAAERLLSMTSKEREDNARDIIFGQLRATIATMDIEEINSDREAFEQKIMENVEGELRKIGLRLINVNITDISDESGYIDALGRKAASEAINRAKVEVAEQNRTGAVGEAEAKKDERIRVAQANASAIEGENLSKISIAQSDALRQEAQAQADSKAKAARLVQEARALEEGYESERKAELVRKQKEEATQKANIIVQAETKKEQIAIDSEAEVIKMEKLAKGEAIKMKTLAEAEAVKIERLAQGEANKTKMLADAEAYSLQVVGEGRGKEIEKELSGQAEGLQSILKTVGDSDKAAMLMIIDKLPTLVQAQVEAVKNLKIDKITVWDSGQKDGDGKTSTANFMSGLIGTLPPVHDLMKSAGLNFADIMKKKDSKE